MGSLSAFESANRTIARIRAMEDLVDPKSVKKYLARIEKEELVKGNGKSDNGQVAAAHNFDKSPAALLVIAKQEVGKSEQRPAIEYAQVVHVLREKGFTWDGIVKWFKARGVNLSVPTLYYAYQKVRASKPGALVTH